MPRKPKFAVVIPTLGRFSLTRVVEIYKIQESNNVNIYLVPDGLEAFSQSIFNEVYKKQNLLSVVRTRRKLGICRRYKS
jgi:hypothetical protein